MDAASAKRVKTVQERRDSSHGLFRRRDALASAARVRDRRGALGIHRLRSSPPAIHPKEVQTRNNVH